MRASLPLLTDGELALLFIPMWRVEVLVFDAMFQVLSPAKFCRKQDHLCPSGRWTMFHSSGQLKEAAEGNVVECNGMKCSIFLRKCCEDITKSIV